MRRILLGVLVIVASFAAAVAAMQWLWPGTTTTSTPVLAETPPLQPITRTSVIVAPVAITISAIQEAIEAAAPADLQGKGKNPLPQVLSDVDIDWTVKRGPLAITGQGDSLTLAGALTGTVHTSAKLTGQAAGQVRDIVGALGGLLGDKAGRRIEAFAGRTIEQRTDLRGTVTIASRPMLLPDWRIEPNLTANVSIADAIVSIAGARLNVTREVRPLIDRAVSQQVAALQARARSDPAIEQAVRREWAKLCRAIPLGAAGAGMPNLWLEMRPIKAFAGQPRTDASTVTLPLGLEAETRIVASEIKPNCPFPAQLEIIPHAEHGRISIGVPIDVPFTEVSRLLDGRLKGRTFPDDANAPFSATVQRTSLAASGDRLLMTLVVKPTRQASFFGFGGGDATVHVWGKPVFDRDRQVLRFTNVELAVESEAPFGLLGSAARAAIPYFQSTLESNAVIDLKPFLANARQSIAETAADFRRVAEGVRVEAAVTDLRLVEIAFDAQTLRLIAEADGTAKVAVTALSRN
jgi:hypothetical protein